MIKKIIKRGKYFDKIKNYIGKDLIKIIVGQRRVGKSYFLLQIIDYLKSNGIGAEKIIYVNKENLKYDFIKDYNDLFDYVKNYDFIFIDEIQEIYGWEKAIRSLQIKGKDIYITGSNSNFLSGDLATFLSGRYISIEIFPLDYYEFLQFHNLQDTEQSFEKYMKYGGLPYLKSLELNEEAFLYLSDVVNTVIFKDVINRYSIRNINFFQDLLEFLAVNIGNIFSAKNISDYLKSQNIKISVNSVLEYLKYLNFSFLINEVKRYDIKGKKIFELKNKYFWTDIGMRNAIRGGFDISEISGILENIVYINLVSNGWKVYVGEIYDREVDFVCIRGNEKMYIQVSYLLANEDVVAREFSSLLDVPDSYPKFVVSMDNINGGNIEGVRHLSIRKFLLGLRINKIF